MNAQPKFEFKRTRYKRDTELINHCYVFAFFFIWLHMFLNLLNILVKVLFKTDIFLKKFVIARSFYIQMNSF